MRDSQRQAVYRWERRLHELAGNGDGQQMDLAECDALVCQVWAEYHPDRHPPIVTDGRGRRNATGGRWKIKLPKWARNRITVLHEIGHALQQRQPWHGPEFARIVLELYSRHAGIPKAKAKSLGVNQKPRRVRFARPGDAPQPVTREWKRWWAEMAALRAQVRQLQAAEPPKHRSNGR